ncbi:hypothetical protein CASFOL_025690 [Castilleja foliolosa]|uniref:Uncharacterized protein n=1 Tax=Castilleja foliolosa TaxID=1961234 RepID=A0ABD3CRU8_9LAMI
MSAMIKPQTSHLAKNFRIPTGKLFFVRKIKAFTPQAKMVAIPGLRIGARLNNTELNIAAGIVRKPKVEDAVEEYETGFGAFGLHAFSFQRTAEDDGSRSTILINWKIIVFLGVLFFLDKGIAIGSMMAIGIMVAAFAYSSRKKN